MVPPLTGSRLILHRWHARSVRAGPGPRTKEGDHDDQTGCVGSSVPRDRYGGGSGAQGHVTHVQGFSITRFHRIVRCVRARLRLISEPLLWFTLDVGSSCHADVQFVNVNLMEATTGFSIFGLWRPRHLLRRVSAGPGARCGRLRPFQRRMS
jgi:hypothetical protein